MQVTLIFQEDFVKGLLPLSENVAGGYLRTAMFEAQEIDLKGIVGACLLDRLKATADEGGLEPTIYDTCIDKCLFYLAYRTLVRLIPKVSYKIASAGTYQNTDERIQPLTEAMNNSLVDEYTNSADFFAYELQGWLLENKAQLPELCGCDCERIKANLMSAASCGIWLGGMRGYKIWGANDECGL